MQARQGDGGVDVPLPGRLETEIQELGVGISGLGCTIVRTTVQLGLRVYNSCVNRVANACANGCRIRANPPGLRMHANSESESHYKST